MSLGISVKEKELDPRKDITKWPREFLEKKYNSHKRFTKFAFIAIAILGIVLLWQTIKYSSVQDSLYSTEYALNVCTSDIAKNCSLYQNNSASSIKSPLTDTVISFFKWITNIDQPYFFKLMILLGIVYLIQIIFACAVDIVEVVLLIFVLIKRLVVWIYHLIKPQKEE